MEHAQHRGVIPAEAVRRVERPVVVDAGAAEVSGHAMAVRPIVEGDTIVALDVRCGCGQRVLIECEYDAEAQR